MVPLLWVLLVEVHAPQFLHLTRHEVRLCFLPWLLQLEIFVPSCLFWLNLERTSSIIYNFMGFDLKWIVFVVKSGPVGAWFPPTFSVVVGDEVCRGHGDKHARVSGADCLRHWDAIPVLHVGYVSELVGYEPPVVVCDFRFPVLETALCFNCPNSITLIPF